MTDTTDELAPGEARKPGPSLQELLLADGSSVPDALLEQSYEFRGDEDIPFDRYTSRDFAQAEFERLWSRVWQWACREEHIPEPGDYYVYDIGHLSALVVRTEAGDVKGYVNSCMHRGTQLKQPGTCGFSKMLKCPFHGWTWSLEGQLIDLPEPWDFPHANTESHALAEVKVGTWAGFVFVNFDENAGPLEDYLGVLPRHFADWGVEDRYIETHVLKRLPCNWKAAAEAFVEAYHVKETHAGGLEGTDVPAQYDVFGENVSRFIHQIASRNVATQPPLSEQEELERIMAHMLDSEPTPELPDGVKARDFYAAWQRERVGEAYGRDFSHLTTTETLDSIEYFLFPNAFFFPGLTLPMIYRFRPDADNPDFCTFDLLMLRPKATDGTAPPPPPDPLVLDIDDSYTTATGLGRLGRVYDQDTANMGAQTRGFKASRKRGQTLGNYQEVRVRHLHQRVDAYLARD